MMAIESEPKWYHITDRSGGFTVGPTAGAPMPERAAPRVAVAYDLPSGDPLRNWGPLAFRFGAPQGAVALDWHGLRASKLQDNVVMLTEFKEDFWFTAHGFDEHRDLFVPVDDDSDSQAEGT